MLPAGLSLATEGHSSGDLVSLLIYLKDFGCVLPFRLFQCLCLVVPMLPRLAFTFSEINPSFTSKTAKNQFPRSDEYF